LVFEGTYGLSGLAGRPGQGYSYSGGASYTRGALSIATTYFQATNPDSTTGAQRTGWAGSADSIFDGSSINNAYESARTLAIYQLGAQYVIGSLTFGGSYSNSQFRPDGQSSFASTERFNNGKAFLSYQLSPQFSVQAGYAYKKRNTCLARTPTVCFASICPGLRGNLVGLVGPNVIGLICQSTGSFTYVAYFLSLVLLMHALLLIFLFHPVDRR
jgi:predicted porin